MPERDSILVRGNPAPVMKNVSNLALPWKGIIEAMAVSNDLYIISPIAYPDKTSYSGSGHFVGVSKSVREDLPCSSGFVSVTVVKHSEQKQFRGGMDLFGFCFQVKSIVRVVRTGTPGRNLSESKSAGYSMQHYF